MRREEETGIVRFVAEENITASNVRELQTFFIEEMESVTAGAVVLDLSPVDFVDSSGLTLVIGLSKTCNKKGVTFRLDVRSADILRVLRTCNLHNLFEIREVTSDE